MKLIDQQGNTEKIRPGVASVEARRLAGVLSDECVTVFTYGDLSAAISMDVRGAARGYLLTAREIVLRERGFVFRPLRNVGLKRLTHQEIAALDDRFQHVRRTHKKTIQELSTVDLATLPDSARIGVVARVALAHMTVHSHGARQVKQLEAAAGSAFKLDLARTLDVFREAPTGEAGPPAGGAASNI